MRLIDADALLEAMRKEDVLKVYECIKLVNNALTVQREGWVSVPQTVLMTIARLLDNEMNQCVESGANSVSMPDDLVELAVWLSAAPTDKE